MTTEKCKKVECEECNKELNFEDAHCNHVDDVEYAQYILCDDCYAKWSSERIA